MFLMLLYFYTKSIASNMQISYDPSMVLIQNIFQIIHITTIKNELHLIHVSIKIKTGMT